MSLNIYNQKEDLEKDESINNYLNIFLAYKDKEPTLEESLEQMFISSGVSEENIQKLIEYIISKSKELFESNSNIIKEKYPQISEKEALTISSFTCEIEFNKENSPYKILNKNLLEEDKISGINNISKYLYLLLKALRKLPKYIPKDYLYRGIKEHVNIGNENSYKKEENNNKTNIPYIRGNIKTFWTLPSTFLNPKTPYKFIGNKGTLFILEGDKGNLWGYDITLFNIFKEEEILLEPERKFKIINSIPPLKGIIIVNCEMQDTPLVLNDLFIEKETNNNKIVVEDNLKEKNIDFKKDNNKCIIINENNVNNESVKNNIENMENNKKIENLNNNNIIDDEDEKKNKIIEKVNNINDQSKSNTFN